MGMTKRWLESLPEPKQKHLNDARDSHNYAQLMISRETQLNEQEHKAILAALGDALLSLKQLESEINKPEYGCAA